MNISILLSTGCGLLEVTLLLLALEKQGKVAEALDVVRGDKGNNLMIDAIFKETRIAEMLLELGRVDESNALYKQLILERCVVSIAGCYRL